MSGIRPIVYPGGAWRASREVAEMNDEHSSGRLPVHPEFTIYHPSGDGWYEVIDEITTYNAVDEGDAGLWLERMLIDPGLQGEAREYRATVLGVRCRLVRTDL